MARHHVRSMLVFVPLLLALLSCHGEQSLHDDCVDNPGDCQACKADDECVIVSNECHANAYCTSRNRNPPLGVTQEGCNFEYDKPAAERCGCLERICRSR
jgi:hypothetical protein